MFLTTKLSKLFSFIIISFFTYLNAESKVVTVSNNPNIPAEYKDLQAAIDSPTDTVYIHKCPVTIKYPAVNISKKIVLIGSGHYSANEDKNYPWCGTITLKDGSSGTVLAGLYLDGITVDNAITALDDLVIKQCRFSYYYGGIDFSTNGGIINNTIIEGCVFNGYNLLYFQNATNVLLSNNIFGRYLYFYGKPGRQYIFINNLVLANNDASDHPFDNVSNSIFANNIFYKRKISNLNNCSQNSFRNNIVYTDETPLTSDDLIKSIGFTNDVSGTIALKPTFKAYPVNASELVVFSEADYYKLYNYDFTLAPTSPGINGGTDGKNIGLTENFRLFGSPVGLPLITSYTIQNTIVNYGKPGDPVKVKVTATGKK